MLLEKKILELNLTEKLILIEKIELSLISNNSSIPLSIKNELDKRLERLKNNKVQFKTWDEIKKVLKQK